jgi:hypothetical protein
VVALSEAAAGEDVADLADADGHDPRLGEMVEHRPLRWGHREILAVVGSFERARLPDERPRDDAADPVGVAQPPRRGADRVQLGNRDHVLVRGDLEDRIRRRVQDHVARVDVLGPELLDDLGATCRNVPEHSPPGRARERLDQFEWEAGVREGRERLRQHDAHHLPVPGRGVLAARSLAHASHGGAGLGRSRNAGYTGHSAVSGCLECREVETADGGSDVAHRVGSRVAILVGIRGCPAAARVEDDRGDAHCASVEAAVAASAEERLREQRHCRGAAPGEDEPAEPGRVDAPAQPA